MQSTTSNKDKILDDFIKIIKTTSNDMVLGEKIRKYYNQIKDFDK